jgi:hypothetical protein
MDAEYILPELLIYEANGDRGRISLAVRAKVPLFLRMHGYMGRFLLKDAPLMLRLRVAAEDGPAPSNGQN